MIVIESGGKCNQEKRKGKENENCQVAITASASAAAAAAIHCPDGESMALVDDAAALFCSPKTTNSHSNSRRRLAGW